MDHTPVALGLYVCERVEIDPVTRLASLVNRRTRLRLPALPAAVRLDLFAVLTDGAGELEVGVSADHLDSDRRVGWRTATLRLPDRLAQVVYHLRLDPFRIAVPGTYQFSLSVAGEPVARAVLGVSVRPTGG
jgi:hypothetical protein